MTTVIENLPNVCIRNITLDNTQESKSRCKITVDVVVKAGNNAQWVNDDFLLKHLSLVVVKSSNEQFNVDATSGQIMINGTSVNSYSTEPGDIVLKQIPLLQKIKQQRKNIPLGDSVCMVTLEFYQSVDANSVDIYAMTTINMLDISNSYGVNLNIQGMNNYCGPIVSESIFRNGAVVTQSNLFRIAGGEEYYGPVHQYPGTGWMAGSRHTQMSHPKLSIHNVPNTKLKDNRVVSYATNNILNHTNNSIFSSLETTIDKDKLMNGIFSININTIALTKTKYGRLFYNLKPEIYNQMLSNFRIKYIKIFKSKVKQFKQSKKISKYLSTELLIDSKDPLDDNFLISRLKVRSADNIAHVNAEAFNLGSDVPFDSFQRVSHIKEQSLDLVPWSFKNHIRSFSFVDAETKTKFDDKYSYRVDIGFYDSSIATLQGIMQEIETSILSLDRYINLSLSLKNYDFRLKKLKPEYVSSLGGIFGNSGNVPWINSIVIYAKYYALLKNLSDDDQNEIMNKYYNFLNPTSFDARSAKSFLYKFKEFSYSFMKYFKISNKKMHNLVSGNSQEIYQNVNFSDISLSHQFSNVLDFQNSNLAFNYLLGSSTPSSVFQTSANGNILILTKAQFEQRFQLELQRFPFIGGGNSDVLYSYLSPLAWHQDNTVYDLANPVSVNYRKLIAGIQQVSQDVNFEDGHQMTVPNNSNSTNPADMLEEGFETADIDYTKASRYIGHRYGSLGAEDTFEEYPNSAWSEPSTPHNESAPNIPVDPNDTSEDDPFSSIQEQYWKDIMGQTLYTPRNKALLSILFFSLQRVEYKEPHTDSYYSMKKDNWKLMTPDIFNNLEGSVLFRLVPASSRMFPQAKGLPNLSPHNRVFIVNFPKSQVNEQNQLVSATESLLAIDGSHNSDYLVSNIVTQPSRRDGVNFGFVYTTDATTFTAGGTLTSTSAPSEPTATPGMTTSGGNYGY